MARTAAVLREGEELELRHRLITVHDPDWVQFQELYGKGNVSARIRELVREDLERSLTKA